MSTYPGQLDQLNNPTATQSTNDPGVPHAAQHTNANDAIEAIQAELGVNPSGVSATVAARLDLLGPSVLGAQPQGTFATVQARLDSMAAALATAQADIDTLQAQVATLQAGGTSGGTGGTASNANAVTYTPPVGSIFATGSVEQVFTQVQTELAKNITESVRQSRLGVAPESHTHV